MGRGYHPHPRSKFGLVDALEVVARCPRRVRCPRSPRWLTGVALSLSGVPKRWRWCVSSNPRSEAEASPKPKRSRSGGPDWLPVLCVALVSGLGRPVSMPRRCRCRCLMGVCADAGCLMGGPGVPVWCLPVWRAVSAGAVSAVRRGRGAVEVRRCPCAAVSSLPSSLLLPGSMLWSCLGSVPARCPLCARAAARMGCCVPATVRANYRVGCIYGPA